jgi:hypothetical protein
VEADETNSNFGFNLSWWDRLFGTYREAPRAGQVGMTIGIEDHRDPHEVDSLPGMLALPFRGAVTGLAARDGGHAGAVSGYAINRRTWNEPEGRS